MHHTQLVGCQHTGLRESLKQLNKHDDDDDGDDVSLV